MAVFLKYTVPLKHKRENKRNYEKIGCTSYRIIFIVFNKWFQFFGKFVADQIRFYVGGNNYSQRNPIIWEHETRSLRGSFFLSRFFDRDLLGQSEEILHDRGIWIVMFFETFKNIVFRDNFLVSLFLSLSFVFFVQVALALPSFSFYPLYSRPCSIP